MNVMIVDEMKDATPLVRRLAEMNGGGAAIYYARVPHGTFLDLYRANFTKNSHAVVERDDYTLFFLRSPAP